MMSWTNLLLTNEQNPAEPMLSTCFDTVLLLLPDLNVSLFNSLTLQLCKSPIVYLLRRAQAFLWLQSKYCATKSLVLNINLILRGVTRIWIRKKPHGKSFLGGLIIFLCSLKRMAKHMMNLLFIFQLGYALNFVSPQPFYKGQRLLHTFWKGEREIIRFKPL